MFRKVVPLAFALVAITALSGVAQAQTALTNGVTVSQGTLAGSYTTLDLGSTAGTGWVTQMPLSLSYASVNVGLSFTGSSGIRASQGVYNPTPGQNFIATGGTTTLSFSSKQAFFGGTWGSPDITNNLSFYNGSNLIASVSGAQFRTLPGYSEGSGASFSFSETGYDKVVISGESSKWMEMGNISFSDQQVDVAPIPLNAASLGGLLSFIMMLGMRGKGGTQVMVRMAFASLLPRQRKAFA